MERPSGIWQQSKAKETEHFNMNFFPDYKGEYKKLNMFFLAQDNDSKPPYDLL